MNFIDMYKKIAEIDRSAPVYENIVDDAEVAEQDAAGMSPKPATTSFYTPGATFPAAYTIAYNGQEYKFAGRDKTGPGTGEIITVGAGAIGIRGLRPTKVELGTDGMYYIAAQQNEETAEVEQPLDEVAQLRRDLGLDLLSESLMDECGDMPMPGALGHSNQADSVTMNISMNGSGKGGIKDLMDILKNIEDGPGDGSADIVIGSDIEGMEHPFDEVYANEPETEVQPIDAAMPTGNDLSSKGQEAPKVNGGGNPMTMESLKSQLDRLYQEIKESHQEKTTMKHVKNPTAGEKKAAKDIKAGTAGYKDRVDMLKSAEKDGRLKD